MEVAVIGAGGLLRAGIANLLVGVTRRVHEAADIKNLPDLIAQGARIDLVLFELTASQSGYAPAARLREILPKARITILGEALDPAQLAVCLASGADGFLLKDISAHTLIESLKLVAMGQKVFPATLIDLFRGDDSADAPNDLSRRELDILRCLVDGDSNKRIANRLDITEATVKVHLKNILRKTHTANRTQAAIWSLQRGLHKTHPEDSGESEVFESKLPAASF